MGAHLLADLLEDALPQTQCTKCGYPDCRGYAEAMAEAGQKPNRCPPGGIEGIIRLSKILQLKTESTTLSIDPECGAERPRPVALIDPKACIGCTLCIQACPVDAIVGASKQMHTVLNDWCTGCDLCVAPCPVDCISMVNVTENHTGWEAWSSKEAELARKRYHARSTRLKREERDQILRVANKARSKLEELDSDLAQSETDRAEIERKRQIIAAALARAKTQII
jgi:electron transport complex protein RnfB